MLCGQPMSGTLPFDENDYQATHSRRKKKSLRENKEKLTDSTEDFQKNSKNWKDEVSVDFQQKRFRDFIYVNKYKLKYSTLIG